MGDIELLADTGELGILLERLGNLLEPRPPAGRHARHLQLLATAVAIDMRHQLARRLDELLAGEPQRDQQQRGQPDEQQYKLRRALPDQRGHDLRLVDEVDQPPGRELQALVKGDGVAEVEHRPRRMAQQRAKEPHAVDGQHLVGRDAFLHRLPQQAGMGEHVAAARGQYQHLAGVVVEVRVHTVQVIEGQLDPDDAAKQPALVDRRGRGDHQFAPVGILRRLGPVDRSCLVRGGQAEAEEGLLEVVRLKPAGRRRAPRIGIPEAPARQVEGPGDVRQLLGRVGEQPVQPQRHLDLDARTDVKVGEPAGTGQVADLSSAEWRTDVVEMEVPVGVVAQAREERRGAGTGAQFRDCRKRLRPSPATTAPTTWWRG